MYLLKIFGFSSLQDFATSTLAVGKLQVLLLSLFATLCNELTHGATFLFVLMLALVAGTFAEWVTGIRLARFCKKDIDSAKAGRMILKLLTYLFTLVFVLLLQAAFMRLPVQLGADVVKHTFDWLLILTSLMICFHLFVSILENLAGLGNRFATKLHTWICKRADSLFTTNG